jgi:predicted permease
MLHAILFRLRSLLQRRRVARELDAEMQFHLAMEIQRRVGEGQSRAKAERAARIAFGGIEQTKEAVRDVRAFWIEDLSDDIVLGLRTMRRSPGFLLIAVIVLALGFAITGAVFSTVNGLLSSRAAVPHAERLVYVSPTQNGAVTEHYFKEAAYTRLFERKLRTVRDLFAMAPFHALLSVNNEAVRVVGEAVTGSYFRAVGVAPLLGRELLPDDDRAGSGDPVVLGEGAWRRLFAADPGVIGRPVRLSGRLFTIVGVMPAAVRGFNTPTVMAADFWAPIAALRPLLAPEGQAVWGQVYGRLAEGASFRQAEAEMRVAGSRFDPVDAEAGLALLPVERGVTGSAYRLTMGAIGTGLVALSSLVLLIACANLANLLLARSASRSSEVAIRMALGASPSRILRLQFLETGTVTALGGAAGFVIVIWVSRLLGRFPIADSRGIPITGALLLDARVLAFFLVLIGAAAVAIGLLPAMRAIRIDPVQILASSGSRGRTTGRFERMRTLLVTSQVAASTILLIVAGLFVRSAMHASHYDAALDMRHLAIGHFSVSALQWDEQRGRRLHEALLAAARAMPGIRGAALSTGLPAGGGGELVAIEAEDWHLGRSQYGPPCRCLSVSPGFFDAVGPLHVRGRDFTAGDTASGRKVVIVNEVAASRLWPGRDPIGRRLRIRKEDARDVIGVVPETERTAADTAERCYVFAPMEQRYQPQFVLAVKGTGAAESLLAPLAATVARAVPDAAMFDVKTAEAHLNRGGGSLRAVALALVVLGVLGLTIAVVGLYGVMTYVVGLRRAEFGIRKVLGATEAQIYGLVVRDACRMLLIGILAALPMAYVVSVLVARALVGVTSHDATTYVFVPACLVVVGVFAAWWPARRAARVEPVVALKEL